MRLQDLTKAEDFLLSISVPFEHPVFHEHDFSAIGKTFLWVELHENFMAQDTLESRSCMGTLRESHIAEHSFCENSQV